MKRPMLQVQRVPQYRAASMLQIAADTDVISTQDVALKEEREKRVRKKMKKSRSMKDARHLEGDHIGVVVEDTIGVIIVEDHQ